MENQDFDLPSGARFHVSPASFADAKALLKALMKTNIGIALAADPLSMDLTVLKDAALAAATSDEVEAILFRCLERTTRADVKVTPATFDDPKTGEQARSDYYVMAWRVVEVNCKPFFAGALSALKPFLQKSGDSPASK